MSKTTLYALSAFALVCISQSCMSQGSLLDLRPYLEKLESLRNYSAKYEISKKFFFEDDTLVGNEFIMFQRLETGRLIGYATLGPKGEALIEANKTYAIADDLGKVFVDNYGWDSVKQKGWNAYLLPPISSNGKWFLDDFSDSVQKIVVYDSSFGDRSYRVFQSIEVDNEVDPANGTTQHDLVLVFNKSDSMLVAYAETFHGYSGDAQITSVKIRDYHSNLESIDIKSRLELMIDSLKTLYVFQENTRDSIQSAALDAMLVDSGDTLSQGLFDNIIQRGKREGLQDSGAKLIIVDLWYASCPPCRLSIPELVELRNHYKEHELMMVGINPFDKPGKKLSTHTLIPLGVNYAQIYGKEPFVSQLGIASYPTLIVIDVDSRIVIKVWDGYSKDQMPELYSIIDKALDR